MEVAKSLKYLVALTRKVRREMRCSSGSMKLHHSSFLMIKSLFKQSDPPP